MTLMKAIEMISHPKSSSLFWIHTHTLTRMKQFRIKLSNKITTFVFSQFTEKNVYILCDNIYRLLWWGCDKYNKIVVKMSMNKNWLFHSPGNSMPTRPDHSTFWYIWFRIKSNKKKQKKNLIKNCVQLYSWTVQWPRIKINQCFYLPFSEIM